MTDTRATEAFGQALADVLQRHAPRLAFDAVLGTCAGQLVGLINMLPAKQRMAALEEMVNGMRRVVREGML